MYCETGLKNGWRATRCKAPQLDTTSTVGMRLLCYVASEMTSNRTCTLEPIKCFKTMLLVDSAVFTLPFLVGLAAGLVRTGWESALLPSAGLAFRHGVLLAIALCALANAEAPPRRGVLYVLRTLALALCCGWMIASPFARESFALLLVASLLLLASNIASARQRPPMVGLYRIAGSAFFVVGNGLLFPDMPCRAFFQSAYPDASPLAQASLSLPEEFPLPVR